MVGGGGLRDRKQRSKRFTERLNKRTKTFWELDRWALNGDRNLHQLQEHISGPEVIIFFHAQFS